MNVITYFLTKGLIYEKIKITSGIWVGLSVIFEVRIQKRARKNTLRFVVRISRKEHWATGETPKSGVVKPSDKDGVRQQTDPCSHGSRCESPFLVYHRFNKNHFSFLLIIIHLQTKNTTGKLSR